MQKKDFDMELNKNVPGSAEKVCYCLLNKIYARTDKPDIYELALVSLTFDCVQLFRTCDITNILQYGYIYDFSLEDRYLRCNPFVQTATGDSMIDSELNTVMGYRREETILTFLATASNNHYVLIDDSVVKTDGEDTRFGVTLFHNICFSKSTMSIYAPMVIKEGLFNKMIVTEENSKLSVKPFYYGVPANQAATVGDFVKRKTINNVTYDIYYVEFLPVFDNLGRILSGVTINTAVQYKACYDFAIDALTELMNSLYVIEDTKLEWIGGSHSYTSNYCVEFTSSLPKFGKKDRTVIVSRLLCGEETGYESDPRERYLRSVFRSLKFNGDAPTIDSLNATLAYLKRNNVNFGVYLTAVRYYLFHSHESLMQGQGGSLYGGMTEFATLVREGVV